MNAQVLYMQQTKNTYTVFVFLGCEFFFSSAKAYRGCLFREEEFAGVGFTSVVLSSYASDFLISSHPLLKIWMIG